MWSTTGSYRVSITTFMANEHAQLGGAAQLAKEIQGATWHAGNVQGCSFAFVKRQGSGHISQDEYGRRGKGQTSP